MPHQLNLPSVATPPIMPQQSGAMPQQIIEQLRLAQIFQPQSQSQPIQPITQPVQQPQSIQQPTGMEGYEPSTEALDYFNELRGQRPERGKASRVLNAIASGLIGYSDPRGGMAQATAPSRAEQDWREDLGLAQEGMQQERLSNQQLRLIADMMIDNRRAQEALEQTTRRDTESAEIRRLGISETGRRQEVGIEAAEGLERLRETSRVGRAEDIISERKTAAELRDEQRRTAATLQEERLRGRPPRPGTISPSQQVVAEETLARRIMDENPDLEGVYEFTDQGVSIKTVEELKKTNVWLFGKSGEELLADAQALHDKATRLLRGEATAEPEIMERPIPDGSGVAISRDGGKTWKRK